MTHEELLAKLERGSTTKTIKVVMAMKAVLEEHKPWVMETSSGDELGCSCVPELPAFLNPYPCKTVQAIERELA